jgi:hypothetical protein
MANKSAPKKCANPTCNCVADAGAKYCSAHCEGVGNTTELVCHCGHPGCVGNLAAS